MTNVSKEYRSRGAVRAALKDVSIALSQGATLAVVGESGSGKTTLARLVAGLERPTTGSILVDGRVPWSQPGTPSPVQMVFQQPIDALNPFLAIGTSVAEPMRSAFRRRDRARRVAQLLESVGIDSYRAHERPQSFSGGQLQRVVIARALAASPRLLICDEPTSALDVSVQAQIVNLLLDLQRASNFACLFITHDLTIARALADDILVLKEGSTVVYASAATFFAEDARRDPYSQRLVDVTREQSLDRFRSSDARRLAPRHSRAEE